MNKRQRAVYELLKKNPKVKAVGLNKKELKGLAADIAENLDSEDDASDEDVNAEIEKNIEAVLPGLKAGQSLANRVIHDHKNGNEGKDNDGEGDSDDDDPSDPSKPKGNPKPKNPKSDEEMPAWAKALVDSNKLLSDELKALKGERVSDTRKAKLEKLLKDTGKFGERKLRDYKRMKFETDEDFDEFYSEVEEDLKSENQDRANAGLAKLGAPATGGSEKKDKNKPEVLSEDEIKAIAKS